jgi:integrase
MKATLRARLIDNGARESLRLDIYPPAPHPDTGRLTRWLNLGLYLHVNPRTTAARLENKETLILANAIQAKIQLQLQAGQYGFLIKSEHAPADFFAYYSEYLKNKDCSRSTTSNYKASLLHLKAFNGDRPLYLSDINKKFIEDFRAFLLARMMINTASGTFTNFRTVLNQAYRDGLLKTRITELVPCIGQEQTRFVYLTQDELNILYRTPCSSEALKRASLFSAMTGMRFSDLEYLEWSDLQKDDTGYFIYFKQKKTGGLNYLPISDSTYSFLGTPGKGILFPMLKSHIYGSPYFRRWINASGIKKHITFHSFRHTFATLQLLGNTNLKTLSEMLGHKKLETTMIYAHVIDSTKRIAANLITINTGIES